MARACGLDYADALNIGVERMSLEGIEIPVASKQLLIRTKQTVRPHDAADVAFLERLLELDKGDG